MPNKLSQFWQELKRRKVLRVITVYAAVAFIILQLVEILAPSLRLPDWTMNLILVILIVGFIITVIVSWIYDIHPEGGIVKTEPVDEVKEEESPGSSSGWKIASYISFVVIVGLIVLNIILSTGKNEILEKSIAVLPFRNDSPDQEMYFINGTMEEILDNLCKIKDLRVISRNSVEQYRDNPKPTPVVAEEMNVSYVLEGSGQRDGNNIRLTVQLLDARNDRHIWSESYYRKIENIFFLQSEIAQLVADEIMAVTTPQEKRLIQKIPTSNLTAYDFYQRGDDELWKYILKDDEDALDRADKLFHKALEHDSTFAQVYLGIAEGHYYKHYWEDYFSEDFLDSFLILINKALSYDSKLAKAYRFRGVYFEGIGDYEQAIEEYNKALEYNPNDWVSYRNMGFLYGEEPIKYIEYLQKALSLNHGSRVSSSLRNLGRAYIDLGFIEKGKLYLEESLELDRDTFSYLIQLAFAEFSLENFERAFEIAQQLMYLDTTWMPWPIIFNYTGRHREIYSIFQKVYEAQDADWPLIQIGHRIGVALLKLGQVEKAEQLFRQVIEQNLNAIELGRDLEARRAAYYDLGGAYACLGETEKAIHYLKECNKRKFYQLWWVVQWKVDPLFENIRDEPEFQQIVRDVEAKYQAEHERVRQWLEENKML